MVRIGKNLGEDIRRRLVRKPLGEITVYLPFICQAAFRKRLAEALIQRQKDVPDLQETALDILFPILPGTWTFPFN